MVLWSSDRLKDLSYRLPASAYLILFPIQGDLESRIGDVAVGGKFVGDLHYDTAKHTPILIIGHHILHGKVVDCERPFVAIEKKRSLVHQEGTLLLNFEPIFVTLSIFRLYVKLGCTDELGNELRS